MSDLSHPAAVMHRLAEIEDELAGRQNQLEAAAFAWYGIKREREKAWADEFLKADGTDGQRKAKATSATALTGMEEEATWEAAKKVVDVLGTRAGIGQSILKAQGRS